LGLRRTILHVGADKCGSSSIQAFLTRNPVLPVVSGKSTIDYACLRSQGFIGAAGIKHGLKKSITGHQSSLALHALRLMDDRLRKEITRKAVNHKSDLIFSCEGWLRSLARPDALDFLFALLCPPAAERSLEIIAFVRPPVAWINSAWWQWGAWEWQGPFEEWLAGAIRATCWQHFLHPLQASGRIQKLSIEPVQADVVTQLQHLLATDITEPFEERCNVSLPEEAVRLYQHYRDLRPGPHQCQMDHLVLNAVGKGLADYRPTPWVLRPEHVESIIAHTKEANEQLLSMMDESSQQRMLADQRWWQAEAFANCLATDPLDVGASQPPQFERLAHDLLAELGRAVQILQGHGLADVYLRSSRQAPWPDGGAGSGG
jgi:hypothetical protein